MRVKRWYIRSLIAIFCRSYERVILSLNIPDPGIRAHVLQHYGIQVLNHPFVLRHILTSRSIVGTSISTPTTVARAAPEESPKRMVAVAMATSKWFDAPIIADGAASSYVR